MHILGMAKSNFNLKSGQSSKLELDLFKLAFAVTNLQSKGEDAKGYLQVLDIAVYDRVVGWCKKYELSDSIVVLVKNLTPQEKQLLESEKLGNAAGIVPIPNAGQSTINVSVANQGKTLAEDALASAITKLHPNVQSIRFSKNVYPHGIKWDFYGIV